MKSFTIDAGPGTLFKVNVFIHVNKKALVKARGGRDCAAFCLQHSDQKARETGFAAEIHFNRKQVTLKIVVHEAVHAAVALASLCRLDLKTYTGDEWLADSVEHIVGGTLWYMKKHKVKVKMKT